MMENFWATVVLSMIAASVYIQWSVSQQARVDEDSLLSGNNAIWLALPILVLFCAPLGYFFLGNHAVQLKLDHSTRLIDEIATGSTVLEMNRATQIDKIKLEDLILGLRAASSKQPNNGELWFMLAEAYFQLRMIDLADASMARAIRIEMKPSWLVANAQILSLRSNQADMKKSVRLLRQALLVQPGHQSALLTLGFVYLRQQQYQLAINTWTKLEFILKKLGSNTDTLVKQIDFAKSKLESKQ